uniref:Uncharacterized protein n=1 Tax=Lactuca sativa TaxID=4236 RepID=A0A9R1UXA1_LACSA|nr:hypothetical protein LSAT_V11C800411930 [Lactuca sativa]
MAYNHQSNEQRPAAKSCCEKMHEAIFGKPKRNNVQNQNPSLSTSNDNFPSVKPSPHVSFVPSDVKTSQDLGYSYSNNVEDDGLFNDRVSGGTGTGTDTGPNTRIGTDTDIGTDNRWLIPRARVDTVGMNLQPYR